VRESFLTRDLDSTADHSAADPVFRDHSACPCFGTRGSALEVAPNGRKVALGKTRRSNSFRFAGEFPSRWSRELAVPRNSEAAIGRHAGLLAEIDTILTKSSKTQDAGREAF
jgi:hypothetical protein